MSVYKCLDLMNQTDSPQIYKKARKRYLEGRGIHCSFCRYHRGENSNFHPQKSWKKLRKFQYKMKKGILNV